MDIATVGGLLLAWSALFISVFMEGGNIGMFLNIPALILILGGSLGATVISFSMDTIKGLVPVLKNAFFAKKIDTAEVIRTLVGLAEKARREGLLSLESEVENIDDPFLRKGIQLVADAFDMELTKSILETELSYIEERHKIGESVFTTLGGFSPTLGIIGTVLGLVHALSKLEDPSTMGAAIASAFLATFYGISFANLIFLPIGNKLKARNQEEILMREAMIEGILSIQAGDNPRIIEEKLKVFLAPMLRGKVEWGRGAYAER
jgi:chemotaxis protein MotA